jgi:hypothetical protein
MEVFFCWFGSIFLLVWKQQASEAFLSLVYGEREGLEVFFIICGLAGRGIPKARAKESKIKSV